jgi:N-acetyl-anhydromuramyl-L-alanine amidase AmpD
MNQLLLLALSFSLFSFSFAQQENLPTNPHQNLFDVAYQQYPEVPKGMLEAVSFTMTRFRHIENEQQGCAGLPLVYGVMGLTLDGEGYFKNNLNYIAQLSGISVQQIETSPQKNILAFAAAYNTLLQQLNGNKSNVENHVSILSTLSELPYDGLQQDFALNSHLYSVYSFLNNKAAQTKYSFPQHNFNIANIFGKNNVRILSAKYIKVTDENVTDANGNTYQVSNIGNKSPDYPPALSNITSCNFSSRNGTPVSAITIHTIQGSYAGAISWANNCSSNVSYHYVLRSSDGQVTQVVLESNKAWHVGSENPYTIGFEHEGWVNDSSWYTAAMYQSSAALAKDITQSGYGISPLRTAYFPWSRFTNYNSAGIPGNCVKIKGHQHFPNQSHTDPGQNWDWDYYYKHINNATTVTNYTASSGTVTDLGGSSGDYTNDERTLYLIQPTGTNQINLTVNQFDVENTWDYLYIYDGTSVFSPKIGEYTGTSIPSTFTVNGSAVLIEFRSDCATTNPGYSISWNSVSPDIISPTTSVSAPTGWVTSDFTANFTDADNTGGSGLQKSYYQVIDFDGTEWRANANNGFFADNFNINIHPEWSEVVGSWSINSGALYQSDEAESNTNIAAYLNQSLSNRHLYHFRAKIDGSGGNRRAGFHFFADDDSLSNRGNSYFVWFRVDDAKLQIYKVVNDVFGPPVLDIPLTTTAGQQYDYKVIYDRIYGDIIIYRDDSYIASWNDASPINTGEYISFRSGNANMSVESLKVYRSRFPSVTVSVGNPTTSDIRYQNPNPSTPSGKVKSLVDDNVNNISSISSQLINVDWSSPQAFTTNDGTGADIDTTNINTQLSANWANATDPHSNVVAYWYAIGTTAGDSNIVSWTNNALNTSITHTGLSVPFNQDYYFSIRAENGAGLVTQVPTDGQWVVMTTGINEFATVEFVAYPNPFQNLLEIKLKQAQASELRLYDTNGKLILTKHENQQNIHLDISKYNLSAGNYNLVITVNNKTQSIKLIKQ